MNNKYDNLIILMNKSQVKEAYKIYDILSGKGKRPLILATCDNVNFDKRYSVAKPQDYQEIFKIDHRYIRTETYNLFYSLANQEVHNCINLRRLTTYKGVSLWELNARYIFSELASLLYDINIADAIFNYEKLSEVHIINDANKLEKIVKLICDKRQIPYFAHGKTSTRILSINQSFWRALIPIKTIKNVLLSLYFMLINFTKSAKLKEKYEIIFFAPFKRLFFSMLPVVLQYNDDRRLVINAFRSDCSKIMKENKIFYMDSYGYELYGGLFDRKIREFLKEIKGAIYNNIFLHKINYKGLPIGPLLFSILERVIYEDFPEKIREIDSVRKIILSYEPKIVVVADASFDITLIAKSLSKTVVAMHTGHADEFIFFGPLKADVITVEGDYWREYLLSKKAINPDKAWVTGVLMRLPKFDFKKYESLTPMPARSKKIVVFASVYSAVAQGMLEYERIEQIYAVYNAMKNIKDTHLIVKLHAYDNDLNTYKRIAKETGLSDYRIVRNEDMLKLLENCDLLVTHFSGCSYEAVIMGKNVILLSYSSDFNFDDMWDYRRYGVVIAVDDLRELEGYIRKALFDSEITSKLRMNREKYIFDHVYKMDGKAAERVKEVIDRLI